MRIINTDNFNGDYPNEKFLELPYMTEEHAKKVADAINGGLYEGYARFWRVVPNDYVLQPGFEP